MAIPVFAHNKIKPLRQSRGLNQSDIAAELGISRPTYVLMEQGEKEPTLSQLYTLARLLSVDPGELCTNLPAATTGEVSDYPKFKELVAACAMYAADGGSITKTKLAILVYLADFAWFYQTSRPMTGAAYRYSFRGPVADEYFRSLDELYEGQTIGIEPNGTTMVIRLTERWQPKVLQAEELALISKIASKWQKESTEAALNFVQAQFFSKRVQYGELIPYELVLSQTKDSPF